MHEAYVLKHVLKALPVAVDCITCCNNGDTLLIASQQAALLNYSIKALERDNFAVNLNKVYKQFAKGRILQIETIPEFSLILTLVDGVINLHDLSSFQPTGQVKVKGVSYFCTDYRRPSGFPIAPVLSERNEAQSGRSGSRVLRLCVCVKRKLELLVWNEGSREFQSVVSANELSIVEPPRCVAWIGDALCIGVKKEYFIVKTDSGNVISLFPTGLKQHTPIITKVFWSANILNIIAPLPGSTVTSSGQVNPRAPITNSSLDGAGNTPSWHSANEEFALVNDDVSMFVNADGIRTHKRGVKWSDVPLAQEFSDPYLVALLPKLVEIRNCETRQLVQTIEVQEPKMLIELRGSIYVAGSRDCKDVYRLVPVSFERQVNQLAEQKEFELALRLALALEYERSESTPATPTSPQKDAAPNESKNLLRDIKFRYAFELFVQQRYDDAFRLYRNIRIEVPHVIGLFPDLLTEKQRAQFSLKYPGEVPKLQFADLEVALDKLQEYLIGERRSLSREISAQSNEHEKIDSLRVLAQIIDTTLLKCYLQTNYLLIASLLRLPDCACQLEESEKLLKAKEKFNELLILYERRGLHGKALELLKAHASNHESSLHGVEHTISYLQRLSNSHLSLIFEYSAWVFKESPNDALQIFIEDSEEARGLHRIEVLRFLNERAPQLSLVYLEHVINTWNDDTMQFHDALARLYLTRYQAANSDRNAWHKKLNSFLRTSKCYTAESMLSSLPDDMLFEERAIILGRLAMHEEALTVYVHVLNDIDQAEQYCELYYDPKSPKNRDVFLTLFRIALTQADLKALGLKLRSVTYEQDAEQRAAQSYKLAWRVLGKYAARIDAFKAFERVPDGARLSEIFQFVRQIFDCQLQRVAEISPKRRLGSFENLLARVQTNVMKETHFTVNDDSLCATCSKRIGTSVFVRQPNGDLLHFGCSSLPRDGNVAL